MKKILLTIALGLGLLTVNAQIMPCDSMIVTGSQYQLTMEITNINTLIDYWVTMGDTVVLAEDSMVNTHNVYNVMPLSFIPYDTLTTCITLSSAQITCCVVWIWNGTYWARMGMTTGINELQFTLEDGGKIYDLMGRELKEIPTGMYIQNRKLKMSR